MALCELHLPGVPTNSSNPLRCLAALTMPTRRSVYA